MILPKPKFSSLREDSLVVIRSAGERTTELCTSLVGDQVTSDHIVTIREIPFSQAVIRTFTLGLEYGLPWTIAIDADVLVYSRAIHSLVGLAEQTSASTFRLDGRLIDKLFGGPRCVGLHLYRTAHLGHALELANLSETVHRPEYHVVQQMRTAGYTDIEVEPVLGLHDFEQYFRDLYRKGYVHAQKHAEFIPMLAPMWQRLATNDNDFLALQAGVRDGQQRGGIAVTDITQFSESLEAMGLTAITEKPPISSSMSPFRDLDNFVSNFEASDEFDDFLQFQARMGEQEMQPTAPQLDFLTRARGLLKIRSRSKTLVRRVLGTADGNPADASVAPHADVVHRSSILDLLSRTYRSAIWHKADCIPPEFDQRVSHTAPMSCTPSATVELHSLVDHKRLWTFILGVKSLLRFVNNLHVVLHDDGTLTERDYSQLQEQIPSIRVIGRAEADSRIATVLHDFPACRKFRDNNIVMAQVFDFPILAETEKFIAFDSDILIHSSPDEVVAWMSGQPANVLFEEATAPFCPRIDGVDITTRTDVPYRFTQNLCGGFVCGFKSMYNLPLIEDYCKFVLDNCHDRLFRAQTITALSIEYSSFTASPLPRTYQNLFTFAPNPVMRHYYFSELPPTEFLADARKLLKQFS